MCLTWKYILRNKLYWFDYVYGLYMLNIVYVEVIENVFLLDKVWIQKLI